LAPREPDDTNLRVTEHANDRAQGNEAGKAVLIGEVSKSSSPSSHAAIMGTLDTASTIERAS
jgi:hypothetical protein